MNKLLIIAMLLSASLSAQDRKALSFGEALQLTTTGNPQIKALGFEQDVAFRSKKAAFGLRLPNIGVTAAYNYMSGDIGFDFNSLKQSIGNLAGSLVPLFPPSVAQDLGAKLNGLMKSSWALTLQDREFAMAGVSMTMPLYVGGKINAANKAADIEYKESLAKGDQSKNALISELVQRYFGVALARQAVAVREQVLEGMRKHLYDAEQLEKNGLIARGEKLYAQMHVAQAEAELQKAQREFATISSALSNTLGSDDRFLPLTSMFIVNDIESLEYFSALAQEKSPMLKQVEFKESLAKQGVNVQRADFLPKVALMGGYDFANYQLSHVVPQWAVGLGVQLTIFDGLSRENKFLAAKSRVKQVQALGEKAQADIAVVVEKLYNQMVVNAESMPSADASQEFAKEYLRIKEQAFSEGAASSSDVVDARLNLAKIRMERLAAAYNYDVMLAALLEVCGESLNYNNYITNKNITPIIL